MSDCVFYYKMIVVDNDSFFLEKSKELFGKEYEVVCFTTSKKAKIFLNSLRQDDLPNVILINISKDLENFEDEDGVKLARYLQSTPLFSKIPIIFQSNNNSCKIQEKCFELGASDFIYKPYNKVIAKVRISNAIKISLYLKQLEMELEYQLKQTIEKQNKLSLNAIQIVDALVSTIETNHMYTKGHSSRVAEYSVILAKKIKYPKNKLGFLKQAGLLHDIGKLGITHLILNKVGYLSNVEYSKIKIHTTLGYNILSSLEDFKIEKDVALHHHERWDGTGYPCNLKEEEISLEARIVSIADTYDVMKCGRCYQEAKTNEEIANEFEKMAGSQFDPKLASIFAKMIRNGELEAITKKYNIK